MSAELTMTMEQLEVLLDAQKRTVGEYMTRNLSVYGFYNKYPDLELEKTKEEMLQQALKSYYPNDFNVLKKYLK